MDNLIQLGMTILSNPLVGLVTTALINLGTNQISSRLQMSKDIQQHYQEALEKAWQKFAQDVAYVYPGQMSVTDNNKQFWQCLQTEFQALLNQLTGDNSRALPDPESAGKCMSTALAKFLKVNRDGQITALAAKYLEYIKQEIAQRQALNDYLHNLNTEQMFVLLLQTYAITAQMDSKIDVIGATANQMDAKMDVIGTTNNKILDIVTGQGTGFNPATPSPPITSPPAQPVPGYIPREADLEAILTQLTAINNLASTYENLGRFQEALDLQMQLLDKRRTMLGEDHPDTLGAMHNLAITYDDLGRFQEALELQVQALDKRRTMLGEDHPDTLITMHNLASTYGDLGRFQEALELQVQALDKRRTMLGEDHPDTLSTMHNLAVTYGDLGRFQEALELKLQVLDKRRTLLGEDHPATLGTMESMADTLEALDRPEKAVLLREEIVRKRK